MTNHDAIAIEPISPVCSVVATAAVHRNEGVSGAARIAASQASAVEDDGADAKVGSLEQSAGMSEFVRANAEIRNILASVSNATRSVNDAQGDIEAMTRNPVVIIPMPPASADMIERAVATARDMAKHAALTRGAHAPISAGIVDQVLGAAK